MSCGLSDSGSTHQESGLNRCIPDWGGTYEGRNRTGKPWFAGMVQLLCSQPADLLTQVHVIPFQCSVLTVL